MYASKKRVKAPNGMKNPLKSRKIMADRGALRGRRVAGSGLGPIQGGGGSVKPGGGIR